jgi:hypothetical protein
MGNELARVWNEFATWIESARIGDVASVVGVCVSLVGFGLTLWNVYRSKTAAQRAEEAANETRRSIQVLENVYDFAAAISAMEEIKRLHREEAWSILPDRYSDLRKRLINLRNSKLELTEEQRATIQRAVQHLRDTEAMVERANESKQESLNVARINRIMSENIDDLHDLFMSIKGRMG